MGNGSVLPPDIREQVERQASRRSGHVGIGGASQENQVSSQRRNAAVNPDAAGEEAARPAVEVAKGSGPELATCPNQRCLVDLKDEWSFCAKCGTDLMRGGPEKALGITWTEQDIHDYIFRGYVMRDLKVLGNHKITVKSAQPQDMEQIDDYLMNGDWIKTKAGDRRNVSQMYMSQANSLAVAASCLLKFDGESIGDTLAERVMYLRERGAALVDMFATRVQLFNKAITDHIRKEDTISGS